MKESDVSLVAYFNSFCSSLASAEKICSMCKNLKLQTARKEKKIEYIIVMCERVLGDSRIAFEQGLLSDIDFQTITGVATVYIKACSKDCDGAMGIIASMCGELLAFDDEPQRQCKVLQIKK